MVIVHDKSVCFIVNLIYCLTLIRYIILKEKTFTRNTKKATFLKDPEFLKKRIDFLKQRSLEVLDQFERSQRKELKNFIYLRNMYRF